MVSFLVPFRTFAPSPPSIFHHCFCLYLTILFQCIVSIQTVSVCVALSENMVFIKVGPFTSVADFDPQSHNPITVEVLDAGGASCTGLSIFFVDALRAAGIPARVAGTPCDSGSS